MAEGLLEADGNNDLEFVGENYFNILLDNSLLQITTRNDDREECVMHDLVHDLAYSVLGGSHNASDIFPIRYMFLEDKSKDVLVKNAKYLRTLLVMGNICGNMFSEFKCLHVLTFKSYGVIEFPSSIRKLIHLRVLNIRGSTIERLPDWIGELVHLQTLRAEISCFSLTRKHQLPSTLKYLINLRHLCVGEEVDLPAEMGLLTSLRTLERFEVGDKSGYKLEELGSLNNLKGKLEISRLEKVGNKEEAEKANLHKKSKLLELNLMWNRNREGETTNDENVLEGLQPHSNLKKLWIYGFKGKSFPLWTRKMEVEKVGETSSCVPLNNLIEISLSRCSECEEIPMLGQLPNLKSLGLYGLTNVKSINSSDHESQCIVFPALENLELVYMPRLTEWVHTESVGVSGVKLFPRLQCLVIQFCEQLMNFPALFRSSLKKLTIRDIGSYRPLANIFETKLTLLTQLRVEGIDDLECLPNWLFGSNPNLLELEIAECPNLRGLPDGLCTIISLEKLIIKKCQNLEHMGVQESEGSLTCLKELVIEDCNALVYLPCEMVGSSLKTLKLENLSSLQNLAGIVDCLPKLARLRTLSILGVPQFSAVYYVGSHSLELDFSVLGSMEIVDGILQGCNNLPPIKEIKLKWREGWESLPESIQTLTALKLLKLENFGMEELPEWLGNLSSRLWGLEISNCNKLRRLPIQSIAKLRYFSISECPGVCFDISQWPDISHIARIDIDGQRVLTENDDAVHREEMWRNFLERKHRQNSYTEVEEAKDEVEEEAEVEAKDEVEEEDGEAEVEAKEEEESKRGKDLCLSLRCFQRARR
ncbi:putative disease resistance protein RGA4 [Salvia hispanica]|uniref:putative disease resistance protein RGA4 n=1 Tax=Salvia hispanica TaxID=49212 RepID=UPI0020094044|nr:putative disease resistance protein RGA4 [Salvia hispanica]